MGETYPEIRNWCTNIVENVAHSEGRAETEKTLGHLCNKLRDHPPRVSLQGGGAVLWLIWFTLPFHLSNRNIVMLCQVKDMQCRIDN